MGLIFIVLPAGFAQQPVFRAGAASVKVDVQVTEKNGQAITGLKAEDFRILDNGQPQPIAYFGQESEPLDILLLLDMSGSMRRFLQEMGANARSALAQLHPGDRVGVMLFAWKTELRQKLTGDFSAVGEEIRNSVRGRSGGDGTQINAALITAAGYLGQEPAQGRRAVLMVTDNQGLNYQAPDEQAIRAFYDADAVLNAILTGRQKHPDRVKSGHYVNPDFTPADVLKIAGQTGGEVVEAGKGSESFREIIAHIRERYSIQYNVPGLQAGSFHRIGVELAPVARQRYPNAVIRARAGYYASF